VKYIIKKFPPNGYIGKLLMRVNCSSLGDHVDRLGPGQWLLMCTRLQSKNKMFAQAFHAVAKLLTIYKTTKDSPHNAAIIGHTQMSKLFSLNSAGIVLLQERDMIVVSQLFATNDLTGMLDGQENEILINRIQHYPFLTHKLQFLRFQLCHHNLLDKILVAVSTLALLFKKEHNISQCIRKNSEATTPQQHEASPCLQHPREVWSLCP
jgi:hypothetical protein